MAWVTKGHPCLRRKLTTVLKIKCLPEWKEIANDHKAECKYLDFNPVPGRAIEDLNIRATPWSTLSKYRAWCRLRSGLLKLSKKGRCISCGSKTALPMAHMIGKCPKFSNFRAALLRACNSKATGSNDIVHLALRRFPGRPGFGEMIDFAAALESASCK